jgi:hypothetical protein
MPACFYVLAVNLDGLRSQETVPIGILLATYLNGFDGRSQMQLSHRFFYKVSGCRTIRTPFECQYANYHGWNFASQLGLEKKKPDPWEAKRRLQEKGLNQLWIGPHGSSA